MVDNTKNILLTTLGNTFDHTRHNYYSYDDQGTLRYCEGICTAEAGAKYILSKVPIDKIIVLGPKSAFHEDDTEEEIQLRDLCEFGAGLPEEYSEYKFFCYRIMQYLNRVDIEGSDLLETLSEEEKEEMLDTVEQYYPKESWKEVFHILNRNYPFYDDLLDHLPHMDRRRRHWLKHYLFMRMNRSYRMSTADENEDITVQFCVTNRIGEKRVRLGNLPRILELLQEGSDFVNVYVDLQGLDMADAHTLINVLFMLQSERKKKLHIEEIITTTYRPALFTNPIEDQKTRLELSELLSGMDAFLKYGKVDSIRDYWLSRGIEDPHVDKLVIAMQMMDVGITLCSVSDIENGLSMLKRVFADRSEPSEAIESMIFSILENGIRSDYGNLLRGKEINNVILVKWALRKHFYQQALTIIESRVPYDLVRTGVFYYARNAEEKEEFLHRMSEVYWKTPSKDRYQFDDLAHYYIKFYRRREAYQKKTENPLETYVDMRLDELFEEDSPIKAFTNANGKRPIFKEFYMAYLKVGNIRNQISHAQEVDFLADEWDMSQVNAKTRILESALHEFILLYEKVRNGISKKFMNEFMVSQEEFKEYRNTGDFAAENRREWLEQERKKNKKK